MANAQATSLQAQAHVDDIMNGDAAKNRVAVHTFDPEASPQEKAAAAGKHKDKLAAPNGNHSASGKGTKRHVS